MTAIACVISVPRFRLPIVPRPGRICPILAIWARPGILASPAGRFVIPIPFPEVDGNGVAAAGDNGGPKGGTGLTVPATDVPLPRADCRIAGPSWVVAPRASLLTANPVISLVVEANIKSLRFVT